MNNLTWKHDGAGYYLVDAEHNSYASVYDVGIAFLWSGLTGHTYSLRLVYHSLDEAIKDITHLACDLFPGITVFGSN